MIYDITPIENIDNSFVTLSDLNGKNVLHDDGECESETCRRNAVNVRNE
jgi:hypothetical protein